jgi:hypothetical protein
MQEREIHSFSQISEEEIKLCLIDHTSRHWRREKYLNFFVLCVSYCLLAFRSFLRCVILFLQPCWFKVPLKQSHACQTDRQTRCSNLVSGICKGKYMYRYFQNVSPKKYCRVYIQLPCHDAKLLFVESGVGGHWEGKERQRIRRRNIRIQAFLSKQEKNRNIHWKFHYNFSRYWQSF